MTPRCPRGVVPAVCLLLIVLAVGLVKLPVYVERPLRPLALGEVLTVEGRSAGELDGAYLASLVGRRRASIAMAVDALVRDTHRLRRLGEVVPADVDEEGDAARGHSLLAHSVDAAGAAALGALDRPVPRRVGGVRVVDVVEGGPADGQLRQRDVILSADAQPVTAPAELREAVAAAAGAVRLVVERDGQTRVLRLYPAPVAGPGQRRVGLGTTTVVAPPRLQLPMEVTVDAGHVRGPSAGLIVALAVMDLLDGQRALNGGRRVAGTGRIDPSGRVASVSAVATKARGAVAAGADVFLVPASQQPQAERAAARRLRVIGVRNLREAVSALQRRDGVPAGLGW